MNKLAIVGTGPATRELAPFDDPTFDILTMNEAAQSPWCKRWDILFQLHAPEIYTGFNTKNAGHWEWLQQEHRDARGNLKPIFMQTTDPRVPNAVSYPLAQAQALTGLKYLTATLAYVFAWAHLQNYRHVEVYGVEMSRSEYEYQAACYRFWVGFLMGAGVTVKLHSSAHLFEGLLYGYEGNFAFGVDFFTERVAEHQKAWELAETNAKAHAKGLERLIKLEKYQQYPDAVKAYHEAIRQSGEHAGRLSEAERYAKFGERFTDRGGFEFAAASAQRDGKTKEDAFYMAVGKVEYVWNVWQQTKDARAGQQVLMLSMHAGQAAYDFGARLGVYQENIEYIKKFDAVAMANGQVREVN